MSLTTEQREALITLCCSAKKKAYVPYSKFRVGCGLLGANDEYFSGCNVENASYGGTICAERVAIVKAVSEGTKEFKGIAITCDMVDEFVSPCGMCRQVIVEFARDIPVLLVKPDRTYIEHNMKDLLPGAFTPQTLADYNEKRNDTA